MRFSSSVSGEQKAILGGALNGVAECADATRNNRYLVDRIDARQRAATQSHGPFRDRRRVPFRFGARMPALFSRPATMRSMAAVKSLQRHGIGIATRGDERCFIDQIGKISSRKAGR